MDSIETIIKKNYNGTHLTLDQIIDIQAALQNNMKCKHIAQIINNDPSTVSKEIKERRIIQKNTKSLIFGHKDKDDCDTLTRFLHTCNGCNRKQRCTFDQY